MRTNDHWEKYKNESDNELKSYTSRQVKFPTSKKRREKSLLAKWS